MPGGGHHRYDGFLHGLQVDIINSGASDFINKPFSIKELETKIKRAIIERNIKEELRRLSVMDSQTGLYNQRQFYARLREEVIRAERQNHPLALIFLELDDFNKYSDTFGQVEGDKLLQKISCIINTQIRQGVDSVYGYGGNKFAIILIETIPDITEVIRKRIKASVQEAYNPGVSVG